ncbi:MAG: LysM peptidoglycan-binding domain-containing M23 family metallopeptidase [Pseudomonadota bacterium]
MGFKRGSYLICAIVIVIMVADGCASKREYWNIKPSWRVANAPTPVPRPRLKPRKIFIAAPPKARQRKPRQKAPSVLVRRGDTLYGLAHANNIDLDLLVGANKLRPPYLLTPGSRLTLPASRVHVVKKGDTGYAISRRYGVSVTSLFRLNGIGAPYHLRVGQQLKIPGRSYSATDRARGGEPPPSKALPGRQKSIPKSQPEPRQVNVSPSRAKGFGWPISGRVISTFGPKGLGLHNDGINIAAPAGTLVRAADTGIVAYASNGLKGFGNLILIRHQNGLVSAYAHNQVLLVSRGQRVEKGAVIARVGQTGSVVEPQLHFEIRKGAEAIDPLRLLPS